MSDSGAATALQVYPWIEWDETPAPCSACKQPAHYIPWEFDTFVCAGACLDELWRGYFEACRKYPVSRSDLQGDPFSDDAQ